MRLDLNGVGMHWAAASLFEEFPEKLSMFNYQTKADFLSDWKQEICDYVLAEFVFHLMLHFMKSLSYLQQCISGNNIFWGSSPTAWIQMCLKKCI